MKPLLLTFDVEEFDLPVEWGRTVAADEQIDVTARGLARLMPVLERHGVRATFFATGVFTRARGDLLRALAAAGHEVAVHGLAHQDDYGRMDAEVAVARLREARALVEAASGQPASGMRTPHLLFCPAERLCRAGFVYDASPHPTWVPGRYNGWRWPRRPWHEAGILRVPISVLPLIRLPLSFVWYRAAGVTLAHRAAQLAQRGAPYLHLYFHPWEAEDVRPYGVPAWLAARTGARFVAALDALLAWAAPRQRSQTVADYAAAVGAEAPVRRNEP